MIRKVVTVLFFTTALLWRVGMSLAGDSDPKVVVYFFWGEGCPHCGQEKPFLEELKQKYSGMVVKAYEVWNNEENKELYRQMATAYGITGGNVPATFIDFRSWIGYNADKAKEIEETVRQCHQFRCTDPLELMQRSSADTAAPGPKTLEGLLKPSGAASPGQPQQSQQSEPSTEHLPLLGEVDTATISLPVLTLVLAGLDGFNPCAFFVLLMLLSLMVHAQSRVRMLVVGGVFVFFSGFVYFLFMAAWLNLFMITGRVNLITAAAGLLAVVIAIINIKDFFCFKQGVSLTISAQARDSLLVRMRGLVSSGSMGGLVAGTVALAVMANMYELLCTAGFPMVFTRALTLQKLSTAQYYLYLVFYNVIYVLPLLAIVLFFVATLGSRKLTEAEGRVLKLVSGLMMLGLGAVLMVRPALLNNVWVSFGMVLGVLAVGAVVFWFDKKKIARGRRS